MKARQMKSKKVKMNVTPNITSVYVDDYINMDVMKNRYGPVVKWGRRKEEKARLPVFFEDQAKAKEFCQELMILKGLPVNKLTSHKTFLKLLKAYKSHTVKF